MQWLFIGTLLGSMVISEHKDEEACKGRQVMLAKKDVTGQCIQQPLSFTSGTITTTPQFCTNTTCYTK